MLGRDTPATRADASPPGALTVALGLLTAGVSALAALEVYCTICRIRRGVLHTSPRDPLHDTPTPRHP